MFGYVKCDKPEMKIKEYEAYRGLYCSLCKAIRKHFGIIASLTLSYDMTFFLLMRLSFMGIVPSFKKGACPYNPTKKCNFCLNAQDELKYSASVSMMMFYHKVRDNISDSSFFKRLLMYLILPYAYFKNRKAEKLYPEISNLICVSMKKQAETEKSNTDSPDLAAHSSADALGKLLAFGFSDENGSIYRFGYGVGKWVYLCDAADDLKDDLKKGSFNVFVNMLKIKDADDITEGDLCIIEKNLNMSCAMAAESFEETEQVSLSPIVRNIIYGGTKNVTDNILKGKNKNERSL